MHGGGARIRAGAGRQGAPTDRGEPRVRGLALGNLSLPAGNDRIDGAEAAALAAPYRVHCSVLLGDERELREGIPVTSLARTYLDLAATERRRTVERALDRASDLNLFDLGPVEAVLVRCPHHAGVPVLRAVLDVYREPRTFTRSGLERRFLELVREAGLPEPSMNRFVAGYELDAWWEAERFGVELDVYATHGSRLSFEEDRERDDELLLAGIETTRVTGPRLEREPGAVVDSLRRHLARRSPVRPARVVRG